MQAALSLPNERSRTRSFDGSLQVPQVICLVRSIQVAVVQMHTGNSHPVATDTQILSLQGLSKGPCNAAFDHMNC
jgi:hypothetical protein